MQLGMLKLFHTVLRLRALTTALPASLWVLPVRLPLAS